MNENMEWISVKDRLPTILVDVLIWRQIGRTQLGRVRIGFYSTTHGGEMPSFVSAGTVDWVEQNKVTHWMPLPEPPK